MGDIATLTSRDDRSCGTASKVTCTPAARTAGRALPGLEIVLETAGVIGQQRPGSVQLCGTPCHLISDMIRCPGVTVWVRVPDTQQPRTSNCLDRSIVGNTEQLIERPIEAGLWLSAP
jgi:hypothetical protein